MVTVENLIAIYTIIDGKINLLTDNNFLLKIKCNDEIDKVNSEYIKNNLKIKGLNLKQCYIFSKKEDSDLNFSILFMDIVNYNDIKKINNFKLVPLDKLDLSNIYIGKSIEYLKKDIILYSTIKKLYPDEFVLPEIQKIYENLLNKKYDRRNFRKKLIKLDVIEDLDKINSNKNGRPAKLYKFKDIKEDKALF